MTTLINNLESVQKDLTQLKDPKLKDFHDQFNDFQDFLNKYNLDLEYFQIYPYDELKYKQLILSKGDLVFRVIDDLTGSVLSQNLNWTRNHYYFDFKTLELNKSCPEELNHNFTPFNIHRQDSGFYLESWDPTTIVDYIQKSSDYLFLPLYQDNPKSKLLHVSLIVIQIKDQKVYHWDPNGHYSVFYDKNDPQKDIIPAFMEMTIANFFTQIEFQEQGYNFTYVPNSDLPLYHFNTPRQKYEFDQGDCFIHFLLVPYLITKLKSLENVIKFYQKLNKEYQSFLIYNFSSYLVQKYPDMITEKEIAQKYIKDCSSESSQNPFQPLVDYLNSNSTKSPSKDQISKLTQISSQLSQICFNLMNNLPSKDHPIYQNILDLRTQIKELENLQKDF